jgi:hypothetical protein
MKIDKNQLPGKHFSLDMFVSEEQRQQGHGIISMHKLEMANRIARTIVETPELFKTESYGPLSSLGMMLHMDVVCISRKELFDSLLSAYNEGRRDQLNTVPNYNIIHPINRN